MLSGSRVVGSGGVTDRSSLLNDVDDEDDGNGDDGDEGVDGDEDDDNGAGFRRVEGDVLPILSLSSQQHRASNHHQSYKGENKVGIV